jgi:N-acetyl-gamma-glutamyl-phosphate reductase
MRLVFAHPHLSLVHVTSASEAGRRVSDLYPALAGIDLAFAEPDADAVAAAADVAFLAVPHTAAMGLAPVLLDAGLTVIDLSADFRFDDASAYEATYGVTHTAPELSAEAPYGLPELGRDALAGARLVACPGCYPTATLLAAVPALSAGLAGADRVVVDAKSGVSGAGRTPSAAVHYCTANESLAPYKVAAHRHAPEITEGLRRATGVDVGVVFAPHLVPMNRGLLATVYLDAPGIDIVRAHAAYAEAYDGEPFVTVHEPGRMPATAEVTGTNRAHVGLAVDEATGTLVVACVIDNLLKGASGQAVQCANLALGLPESEGLESPGAVV